MKRRNRPRARSDGRIPPGSTLEFNAAAVFLIVVGVAMGAAGAVWELNAATAALASDSGSAEIDHFHGDYRATARGPGAAPAVFTGLGIVIALVGVRRSLDERLLYPGGAAVFAASSLLLADGVIHFYALADHAAHFPFDVFFTASGLGLLAVGILVLWERSTFVFLAILGTGALIALYFASRLFTLPFESQPEPFEVVGVMSKTIEFAALVPLYLMFTADVRSAAREPPADSARGRSRSGRRAAGVPPGNARPKGEAPR